MTTKAIEAEHGGVAAANSIRAMSVAALATVGVFAIWGAVQLLWTIWTEDPLKSIGGLVPLVSLLLLMRVWRATGYAMRGSWWGLAGLAATVALVHLRDGAVLEFVFTPSYTLFLPPLSLVGVAYAASIALLFGGWRLVRAAWFPLLFMLLVNPVPHVFTRLVDLPLQHASSATARTFAHLLGQRLTPDQLYLMFTPSFGMFIAPGCNGIRGAITLALIALVAGHLYRFRVRTWALLVVGALALGYVFNLVRLCVLVLYYLVALHVAWLRPRATMGDYVIGACLFFVATMLLFAAIRRWGATHDLSLPAPFVPAASEPHTSTREGFRLRWGALLVLLTLGSAGYVRQMLRPHPALAASEAAALFPQLAGPFRLQRTWDERFTDGTLLFHWARYTADRQAVTSGEPPAAPISVAIGIAPTQGAHDSLLCHVARGEDWLWNGTLRLPTASGQTVSFSGSFFQQATDYIEATTVCTDSGCGQTSPEGKRFGLIYSRPSGRAMLQGSRPIPVLLRAETTDTAVPPDTARAALTTALTQLTSSLRLDDLLRPYRDEVAP